MKKIFGQFKIGGILVLIILALTVSGCFKKSADQNFQPVDLTETNNQATVNQSVQKVLAGDYQNKVQIILKPYWTAGGTAGIKDQLLSLTTPAEYLNLHFDLVVAFELIEQGQLNGDQEKIDRGIEKLSQLKDSFIWLAE